MTGRSGRFPSGSAHMPGALRSTGNVSGKASAPAGLGSRSLSGGVWVMGSQGINQGLFVLRTIVAARCLAPSEFGIFGIASLVYALFELFLTTGLKQALIQKSDSIEGDLDTVWTLELIRGLAIFLLLIAAAPLIVTFFNGHDAQSGIAAIRAMAVLFLVQGLSNIGVIAFEREMRFRKFFWLQTASTVMEFAVTIGAALAWRNFWALLAGPLAGNAVRCVLSHAMAGRRLRFAIDWARAKSLFRFSKWVLASVLIGYLCTQGDALAVGRMLDVQSLGIYQMAAAISGLPMTQIAGIIGKVAFPAFSSIQDDSERMRRAYLKTLGIILLAIVPVTVSIHGLSSEFIRLFLGGKWLPAATVIVVLIFSGLFRPLISLIDTVFGALGKPNLGMALQGVRLAALAAALIPLAKWKGMTGVALAVGVGNFVPLIVFTLVLCRILALPVTEIAVPFLRAAASGFAMAAMIHAFKALIPIDNAAVFAACAALGWAVYILLVWHTQKNLCRELLFAAKGAGIG